MYPKAMGFYILSNDRFPKETPQKQEKNKVLKIHTSFPSKTEPFVIRFADPYIPSL